MSNLKNLEYLTKEERQQYLSELTNSQKETIEKWNYVQDNELTLKINPKKMEMLQEFRKNDLPQYPEDEAILDNLVNEDRAEKLRQARQEQLALEKIEQFQKKINPDPINSGEDELQKIQAFSEQFLNEHHDIYKNLEADGINKQDKLAWQIVIYYTLNKGNISQNGLITLPFDTRELALGLLDNNQAVKDKLNEEDPYILPKLAFLHFAKTFVKQLLKYNVIHANENGELVYP